MDLGGITIDCADPHSLAEFWAKALGVGVGNDYGGEFVMLDRQPYVAFQRVSEPRTGKNRVHLDFATDDRQAEVGRLVGLGATQVGEHTMPGLSWTVLQDPAGNEFCVGQVQG